MELQVLSDCYLGLDETISVPFDVLPAAELPEYTAHPEDLELDNDPTIFEQVMAGNVDESSDEEDDGDDDEEGDGAAEKGDKVKGKKKQVVVEDDDEDDEDDD